VGKLREGGVQKETLYLNAGMAGGLWGRGEAR
jgi:hypothetical protein